MDGVLKTAASLAWRVLIAAFTRLCQSDFSMRGGRILTFFSAESHEGNSYLRCFACLEYQRQKQQARVDKDS